MKYDYSVSNSITSGCACGWSIGNPAPKLFVDWMDLVIESVNESKVKKPRKRSSYRRMKEMTHTTVKGLGKVGRALRGIV